jgi:hypothetical protein
MSDDKPSPFEDLRKGLGLLFRAAKTTVERLPKTDLEEAVVTSAREVGRAIENVGKAIEREVFGKKDEPRARVSPDDWAAKSEGTSRSQRGQPGADAKPDEPKPDEPKPPDAA